MKIRTKPQEYEAMQFDGNIEKAKEFIGGTDASIYIDCDCFILSNFVGNHRLHDGDYLYKFGSPLRMIQVIHNDHLLDRYFEIVEDAQ